jgi:hypothetical protein
MNGSNGHSKTTNAIKGTYVTRNVIRVNERNDKGFNMCRPVCMLITLREDYIEVCSNNTPSSLFKPSGYFTYRQV